MKKILLLLAVALLVALLVIFSQGGDSDLDNTLYLDTKHGKTIIELREDLAPLHVERIKKLVREGFYDGLKFHRVIDGFMAQTGDPLGNGTGGSSYDNVKAEFTSEPFLRGTLGMARAQDPDSANSQFFICFQDARFLDGEYTVFGKVTEGMEFIDAIKKADPNNPSGMVEEPDTITSIKVASDVE